MIQKDVTNLLNQRIVSLRGRKERKSNKRAKRIEFIMFDDGKTYIRLDEQDYHSYHDCSTLAREIEVYEDAEQWKRIMTDEWYGPAIQF